MSKNVKFVSFFPPIYDLVKSILFHTSLFFFLSLKVNDSKSLTFYQEAPKHDILFLIILFPFMSTGGVYVSDFVLVWEVKSRRKRRARCESSQEPQEDVEQVIQEESRSEKRKAQLARWRDKFIQNLQSAGLLLEKVQIFIMFLFRTCVQDLIE